MTYKKGEKVRFKAMLDNEESHKMSPDFFPEVGTVGIVLDKADSCGNLIVKWPSGSTSRDDEWFCDICHVEPVEKETQETRPEPKIELIRWPTADDWMLAYEAALITVGKVPTHEPTEEWKRKILRARHSPIRELKFVFRLTNVPYWVAGHLVRHIHAQPYVGSQRNDRQSKYDRNAARQDAPVNMLWSMGAEELIQIANKRLCQKAATETRELVEQMCVEVLTKCPEFADELVPMCVRNGGVCYEVKPCGRCGK